MTIRPISLVVLSLGTAFLHAENTSVSHPHHPSGPGHQHHEHLIETDRPFTTAIAFGYDSRYVLEGRDVLDGDPILHGTVELSYEDFLFSAWLAESPSNPYNEINLVVEYGFRLGEVDGYLSYNHLRFPNDEAHDHELGIGFSYGQLPWDLTASLDAYYSVRNVGAFIEGSVSREFTPSSWLQVESAVVFGWNEAFVSSGHRGANHIAASISATIPAGDHVEFNAYLSYHWAINSAPLRSPDDQSLQDFLYGGISTIFTF